MLPIYKVVAGGLFDLAELFIKHGAAINVVDYGGDTPLILWVKNGNQEVKLSHLHADPDAFKNLQNIRRLVRLGADIKLPDSSGATPLHRAVARSAAYNDTSFSLERYLLEQGADVNARDKNMRTPLHYAFAPDLPTGKHSNDPVETVTSLLGVPECDHAVKGFRRFMVVRN